MSAIATFSIIVSGTRTHGINTYSMTECECLELRSVRIVFWQMPRQMETTFQSGNVNRAKMLP